MCMSLLHVTFAVGAAVFAMIPDGSACLLSAVVVACDNQGDGLHYQHLVAQLLTRDDPETLWRLYQGLSQCVTIISQQ